MEEHEKRFQEAYEIAFLEVHFKKLINTPKDMLLFEMGITKQCFDNAVKDARFSQEFLNKYYNETI